MTLRALHWRGLPAKRIWRYLRALLLWFVALALVSGCELHGLSAEPAPAEPSPLRQNPSEQAWVRSVARQNQEKFRVQFTLPRSALGSGRAEAFNLQENHARVEPGEPLVQSVLTPYQAVLLTILLGMAGLLYLVRVSPDLGEAIARQFTASPVVGAALAEERAFGQFLVSFKAGPSAAEPRPRRERSAAPAAAASGPAEVPSPAYSSILQQVLEAKNALLYIQQEKDPGSQLRLLRELRGRLGTVTRMSSSPGLLPLWQVATATEGLVGQLMDRSRTVGSNGYTTVGAALDLLVASCQHNAAADLLQNPIRILAADDDPISRHAVGLSLKKAFNQPDLATNGEAALAQASAIGYDVIFLDIMMPGLNGFELCKKIRQTVPNAHTPIVFVSAKNDAETVAEASRCGGTDMITKPFLIFELTVKALVLALGSRLAQRGAGGATAVPPTASLKA